MGINLFQASSNFSSLGYEILNTNPREEFSDSFRPVVEIKAAWSNRETIAKAVLGGDDADNGITYLPAKYDTWTITDDIYAVANSVSIEPFGDLSDTGGAKAVPEYAKISIEFAVPTWTHITDNNSDEFVISEDFERTTEFATIANDNLVWNEPGEPPVQPNEAPAVPFLRGVWTMTLHYVTIGTLETYKALQNFVGTCNQKTYYSNKYNIRFEPETLAFDSPVINRVVSPYGEHADVTLSLLWRPNLVGGSGGRQQIGGIENQPGGWNRFPRVQKKQGFATVAMKVKDSTNRDPWFRPLPAVDWAPFIPVLG